MVKNFEKGIFFISISASCISIISLFIKLAANDLSVWSLTFLRFALPILALVPFMWFEGTLRGLWPVKGFWIQIARSFSVAVAQLSGVYYLMHASLVHATIMWCTAPLFMPILSRIFYKHPMHRVTWISILLSFLGVALILQPTTQGLFRPITLFGLLFGLGTAFSQVLYGANIKEGKSSESLFYLFFFCSLFLLFPFLYAETQHVDLKTAPPLILFFMVFAALATIGNQYFRGLAYLQAKSTYLAPFLYFSVVLSGALDWLIFHNPPNLLAGIGLIFVLLGVYLKWSWIKTIKS